MGSCCRFLGYLVKFLFALSLIGLGVQGLKNANNQEKRLKDSITKWTELSKQPLLNKLHEHLDIVKYFDSALFIATGLFLAFGFKGASFWALLAVAIQIALLSNPLFHADVAVYVRAAKFLAILGGVLTLA
jgi:hypothetical protein